MQSQETSQSGMQPHLVSLVCFLAVAGTSIFNLPLIFMCWSLLEKTLGGYIADNSRGLIYLLTAIMQTGLFLLLWLPACVLCRRKSKSFQSWTIIIVAIIYLGFWLACTVRLAMWSPRRFQEVDRTSVLSIPIAAVLVLSGHRAGL
jgi:hypothetical protein